MNIFVALDFEPADYGRDSACAIGTVEVLADWAAEHDYYFYGTPKHQETEP